MPRWRSSLPRKKLPPPITTATWNPAAETEAISRAMRETTSGSTPSLPPPNSSPESLSRTRWYWVTRWRSFRSNYEGSEKAGCDGPSRVITTGLLNVRGEPTASGPDLETSEPRQRGAGLVQHRLDGLLVLGDRRL